MENCKSMKTFSEAFGVIIGRQLRDMGVKDDLVLDEFIEGVKTVFENKPLEIEEMQLHNIVDSKMKDIREKQFTINKAEGDKFLEENSRKEGVVTLPSGLQYKVISEGTGKKPTSMSNVQCHYEGKLINGKVFDSSYIRKQPANFRLNQVIKGWTEGLQLMQEGAKYQFYIPYTLAYGEQGAGASIPPFSTLIFDVELLKVL